MRESEIGWGALKHNKKGEFGYGTTVLGLDRCWNTSFVSMGSLLGLIRTWEFIGHLHLPHCIT